MMDRRTLYVDIDDTILMHDKSRFPANELVSVTCNGRIFVGVPNIKNINMLIKFYHLGYDVYAWSKTGKSWAKAVIETLDLGLYITDYLSKPDFYLDDRDAKDWMGIRVYRDAQSGKETA